jgi:hypothetical protein
MPRRISASAGDVVITSRVGLQFPPCANSFVWRFRSALCGRRRVAASACYRQSRGFPCGDAAGDFANAVEPVLLQNAGGDRRTIAAGAVNQQRPILRQILRPFDQVVQRYAQATLDMLLRAFARRADVNRQRRTARQPFVRQRRADPFGGGRQL